MFLYELTPLSHERLTATNTMNPTQDNVKTNARTIATAWFIYLSFFFFCFFCLCLCIYCWEKMGVIVCDVIVHFFKLLKMDVILFLGC